MTNQPVAQLIADNLPALIHPGDGKSGPIPLPLPMFRTSAIPPGMAQEFAQEAGIPHFDIAKLTGEAIVALLEANGWALVQEAELTQLRTDASEMPDCTRIITLHRSNITTPPVLSITVGKDDKIVIPDIALNALKEA